MQVTLLSDLQSRGLVSPCWLTCSFWLSLFRWVARSFRIESQSFSGITCSFSNCLEQPSRPHWGRFRLSWSLWMQLHRLWPGLDRSFPCLRGRSSTWCSSIQRCAPVSFLSPLVALPSSPSAQLPPHRAFQVRDERLQSTDPSLRCAQIAPPCESHAQAAHWSARSCSQLCAKARDACKASLQSGPPYR